MSRSTGVAELCPFCGRTAERVWVRAHEQCAACGQIIVPCCNGETAECELEAAAKEGEPACSARRS